ncbi:MAG: amidohydrolase family protein [Deltaproteobacteria bacterium]|nr:amidohydrolase family protein [Deltaproteobacteria bacterium]
MHDLVIRGGTIVDGTGKPAFTGDVAVRAGRIAAVGKDLGNAHRTVNADGLLVAPAWVDVHTHYDAQVAWDEQLTPSLWHGVATVIMGNCGVGFAPAAPDRHEWLIGLMEGVEDIPGPSLAAGLPWGWQTFSEYYDVLEKMPRTLDVAGMVTHGAVRAYVMGERGAKNEPATADDILQMAAVVKESMLAGALGFSSSRTPVHLAKDGVPVPGTFATEDELLGIVKGMRTTGRGIFEVVPAGVVGEAPNALLPEIEMMIRISRASGCPLTFLLGQGNKELNIWREVLQLCATAVQSGVPITPMVFARPVTLLLTLQSENPFKSLPSFKPLRNLPLAEKVAALRNPELRRTLLAEREARASRAALMYHETFWEKTYRMGQPLNYLPAPDQSIAAIARREGRNVLDVVYDELLAQDGHAFLMNTVAGYADGNANALREMMTHPITALGGSDAGAHVSQIMDASMPTYMLTHWVRGLSKDHPDHLPLELVVKKLTHDGARLFGLKDRGTLEPGAKADVNLIDYENLHVNHPELVHDLPAGMPRLMQTAKGYVATYVSGQAVQENGHDTGARPGKIVRAA